jgi:preprotein translocase subunit SecD
VLLGGTMVGTGHHTPQLGIDLAGGTTLTMTAKGKTPSSADMDTAVTILQNRVNGQGVSEAEVTKQGNNTIEVDLPGKNSSDLLHQLGQTAQLYFRKVVDPTQYGLTARTTAQPAPPATPTTPTSSAPSSAPSGAASSTPSAPSSSPSKAATTPTSGATSAQHRVADSGLAAAAPSATPTASSPSANPTTPSSSPSSGASAGGTAAAPSSAPSTPAKASDGSTRQTQPDAATVAMYETIDCTNLPANFSDQSSVPSNYVVGCDYTTHVPYLLGPADVSGKDLTSASARQQTTGGSQQIVTGNWEVDLSLDGTGTKQFADVTGALNGTGQQFAIALDGFVYSAPTVNDGAITGGQAMISGNFTMKTANDLANVLKYGALPISFDQGDVSQVSASLAGSSLTAGLIAGAIGMALVIAYLVFYYRGLSLVAVSSLVISGALTYMIATLLGPSIGFRLSLAGVAGLVVAIGITADSFVVFFERLRDEVRDGRSLRTAVDHGWTRARRTIIAADFVSFLAAAVLYTVSIGTVKGFAFTLGLTTLLDILVVFMFTKPVMTLLARRRFFSEGHSWSGLNPERLGAKRAPRQTVADRRRAANEAEGMEA